MTTGVIDLTIIQLAFAYVFVVVLLVIVRARGIKREKEILISCLRMTIQLTLMGYVLLYVFNNPSPLLTALMVSVMIGFAIYNTYKRSRVGLSKKLKLIIALALASGVLVTISFFLLVVIRVAPWYHPQYFIPIAGMIAGNSMTGVTLGVNRLCSDMKDKRGTIENSLMLGATPGAAVKDIVNTAFDSAILPTINNMVGMGIVALPGMMTGQIMSGVLPVTAIKYQIGIMLAIMGSVALTVILVVTLGCKTFFNKQGQLQFTFSRE